MATIASPPAEYSTLSGRVRAGFWPRLLAAVIDVIVVSIPCFALAELFADFFLASPVTAKILGFVIAVAYFAIFGSELVDGQTFGMMALHLQVVKRDGSAPSLPLSLVRYSILLIPCLLNSDFLPARVPAFIANGYEAVMSIAAGVLLYLAVFNRRTGQSLHDLATHTFVVDSTGAGPVETEKFWEPHWAFIFGLLVLAFLIQGFFGMATISRSSATITELADIQNSIQKTTHVQPLNVELKSSQGQTGIVVSVGCDGISEDRDKVARMIVQAVLAADAQAKNRDYISIDCVTTLTIGFIRSTRHEPFTHTPREWGTIIEKE